MKTKTLLIIMMSIITIISHPSIIVNALTYEEMIVSGISAITDKKFQNKSDYVVYAYENNLISKEDFRAYITHKHPTKQSAANFLKNLLNTNTAYIESPYTESSSLSVNSLYYNFIIDPNTKPFNMKDKTSTLTWSRWLKNSSDYTINKLLFIQNQTTKNPEIKERMLNFGFVKIEDSIDMDIYNAFYNGLMLNADSIKFYLEETKNILDEINFKDQLQEDWLAFNRSYGELTSGTKIEVNINYNETDTEVIIQFLYPENYFENKDKVIAAVHDIISDNSWNNLNKKEQVSSVANWIISNVEYPEELKEEYRYSYGALNGLAVCTGYTDLFSIFMNQLNIKNMRVQGYFDDVLHAWNMIEIDNEVFFVDTTLGEHDSSYILTNTLPNHLWDIETTNNLFKFGV